MKLRKIVIEFLVLLAALCLMAPAAQAADVSIGGGIGIAPDYEGSEDYEFVPVPFANIAWSNGMFFNLQGLKAKANLIPSNFWRLGPIYNYRGKRSDVENNQVDAMNSVSDANELGVFLGIDYQNWFVSLEFLADVGNAHDGWYSTLKGGYNWPISSSWSLSIGAHTTYADEDYMETYFGVDANNVGASGFPFYDPDGGFKDVGLDLGAIYKITNNWGARALGSYSLLVGDADDGSPVVDAGDESQFFGALLVVYSF
jgi:outer membrane scaffolding protein for murein synthesis (MipA/OmpV family)